MAHIFWAAFVTQPLKICSVGARFLSSKTNLIIEKYLESQPRWCVLVILAREGSVQGQPGYKRHWDCHLPASQYKIKPTVVSRVFDTRTLDAKATCHVQVQSSLDYLGRPYLKNPWQREGKVFWTSSTAHFLKLWVASSWGDVTELGVTKKIDSSKMFLNMQ